MHSSHQERLVLSWCNRFLSCVQRTPVGASRLHRRQLLCLQHMPCIDVLCQASSLQRDGSTMTCLKRQVSCFSAPIGSIRVAKTLSQVEPKMALASAVSWQPHIRTLFVTLAPRTSPALSLTHLRFYRAAEHHDKLECEHAGTKTLVHTDT